MKSLADYVKEMETNEVIELDPQTFKYADALTESMRHCEDPFEREIKRLDFQMNPAEPT
jgi:hypothetical protein